MSDDEYDYEFEYSDEDAGDAGSEGGEPSLAVQLENSFYHNKSVFSTRAFALARTRTRAADGIAHLSV